MDKWLTGLYIAGSVASVAALLIWFVTRIRKTIQTSRAKEQEAVEELELVKEAEVALLESASKTVSARTDLGFYVLLRLNSLRSEVHRLWHKQTECSIWCVICIAMFFCFHQAEPPLSWMRFVVLALLFVCVAAHGAFGQMATRMNRFADSYEVEVRPFFQQPVVKRFLKAEPSDSPADNSG